METKLYRNFVDFALQAYSADIANNLCDEYRHLPPRIYSRLATAGNVKIYNGSNMNECMDADCIILAGGIENIADDAFAGNDTMRFVILPDSIRSIGNNSFANCQRLEGVVLPSYIASVGSRCFYGCTELEFVYEGFAITDYIGAEAFAYCLALNEFERVRARETGASVFECCVSLRECLWNSDTIPVRTFKDCTALESVYIGANYVGEEAFDGCENLRGYTETIYFDGFDERGNRAGGEIRRQCFLPSRLTHIGKHAFRNCRSLTSLEIPYMIQRIEDGAFEGCTELKKVKKPLRYHAESPFIAENIFYGCSKLSRRIDVSKLL